MTVIIKGDSGVNLDYSTGGRITGDFSNATIANRVLFQTSTANGNTFIRAIPNGTATQSSFQVINSSDAANCSLLQILATAGDTQLSSGINGTGTYLPMTFYTGGTESLRLSKDYKTVILSGGSTSANGTGITFPATQSASSDANTLDDYEEGTWTPSIYFGASAGYSSYNTQIGTYTKIGNVVTARCYLYGATKSAATGSATLNGLPFATKTGVSYQGGGFVYAAGMSSLSGGLLSYTGAENTAVILGQLTSTGFITLTNSNFNTGSDFMFQWTYLTN